MDMGGKYAADIEAQFYILVTRIAAVGQKSIKNSYAYISHYMRHDVKREGRCDYFLLLLRILLIRSDLKFTAAAKGM
jgi:hypothetical protein